MIKQFILFCIIISVVSVGCQLSKISLKQKTWGLQWGDRVFVDESGRERIFHGVNAVVKGPPYIPIHDEFSIDLSLTNRDFEIMQELGLNVIRLGTMWPGVEPERNEYNETYIKILQNITETAASYGIHTLLDMHQDVLSEQFCGEGIPKWAVKDDGKFKIFDKFPSPLDKPFTKQDKNGFPVRSDCDKHTWTAFHVAEAVGSAYQSLWKNVDGIRDSWAQFWQKIASQFQDSGNILGIELINEPFAGDFWHNPLMMVPIYPISADYVNMQEAYDEIVKAVRKVDEDRLIFFAGVTWDDLGVGFKTPPGGNEEANRSVIAYHYYSPPQFHSLSGLIKTSVQFEMQLLKARSLKTGMMLTETCNPVCTQEFSHEGGVADAADYYLQSYATWEWKEYCRESNETLASDSQFAEYGACKTGFGPHWNETTQMPRKPYEYARSYARAIAGEAISMSFNQSSKVFKLQYSINVDIKEPTEIYVSTEYHYTQGVKIVISPAQSASFSFDKKKRLVFVTPNSNTVNKQVINVIITNEKEISQFLE